MDPTQWPLARSFPRPRTAMKALIGLLVAMTLALGSGCAKQDWIDRTLVTVDVTGTWSGRFEGMGFQPETVLDLKQGEGSRVTGFMRITPSVGREGEGPIDGTVSGDVFRFRQTNGSVEGQLTVSGDEMNGRASLFGSGRSISLRRVDPSSPPGSPPR